VRIIETVCTCFFTVECLLRTYIATVDVKRMMLGDPNYWIDVMCVVPYYVELGFVASEGWENARMPTALRFLQLLRLLRIIKLFRHYSGWRVLILALQNSWRALIVPCFAMYMTIAMLSGALFLVEEAMLGKADPDDPDRFQSGFDSMWCIFWIVASLGYDGYLGADHTPGKLIVALAICAGLLFTTMPITIIGEAFRAAWEKKEVIEVQMKIQDLLVERGLTVNELNQIFRELDSSGDGTLDWGEFKAALRALKIKVPVAKVRSLFQMFDEDESGEIEYLEFCRILFPHIDEIPGGDQIGGGESEAADEADSAALSSPVGATSPGGGGGIPPPAKRAAAGGIPPPSKKNALCNARLQMQAIQAFQGGGAFTTPSSSGTNGPSAVAEQGASPLPGETARPSVNLNAFLRNRAAASAPAAPPPQACEAVCATANAAAPAAALTAVSAPAALDDRQATLAPTSAPAPASVEVPLWTSSDVVTGVNSGDASP